MISISGTHQKSLKLDFCTSLVFGDLQCFCSPHTMQTWIMVPVSFIANCRSPLWIFLFFCLRGKPDFSEPGARNSWNGSCFCDFLVFAINATSANSSNHRHSPMIFQSLGPSGIPTAPAHTHEEVMSKCCHFTHFDQNWRIRCLSVLQCKTWLDAAGFACFLFECNLGFGNHGTYFCHFLVFDHQCHICKLIKS